MKNIKVAKRDGRLENVDMEKIHKVITWAAEGLEDISVSQVELRSHLQLFDGIKTADIHETMIKSAADLISIDSPDYQYLAARLNIYHLRKKAFGQFEPPPLYQHVQTMVEKKLYDAQIITKYSQEELEELDQYLDHWRDMSFSYAAVKQLEAKYLVQNRVTGQIYESAQFLYVLIGAYLFIDYAKKERLDYVKRFYDAVSLFKISLPTPIMAGLRTMTRQFSSCVLIESDDNLDSINASAASIVKYVSQRAGIGINGGRIRALGSPIRGGEAFHTGCIPFFKHFFSAIKSCSQGGIRGGAATLFYPAWHLEVEDLLVLKNNMGTEENRIRHLDYAIQINGFLYQRFIEGGDITLFSPHDVPDLYEAFFANQVKFKQLYLAYEHNHTIRKKTLSAQALIQKLIQERANTGRIYIQNVDHCNTHSAFNSELAPIRQSNLCMEITLPTKPLSYIDDSDGEIALCTLSAFNLGALNKLDDLEDLADICVRALDGILDYQNYPIKAAEISTKKRRPLGIGITNFAYYLAKNKVKYSDGSANDLVHTTLEAVQYYCLKASNKLAQEKGACSAFSDTSYAQNLLPIDTYKKTVDSFCRTKLKYDWETLRIDIKKYGLRNSTLTALMPCETSSQISNSTNGIEPPRGYISVKQSKDGLLKQVVPEYKKLRNNYELLWDIPDNNGYLQLVAIMQKFVDQSISSNTHYDPSKYAGKLSVKILIQDILTAYKYGLKTLYYHVTRDGSTDKHNLTVPNTANDCVDGMCTL